MVRRDVEKARQLQSTGEWALDELGVEIDTEEPDSDRELVTAEERSEISKAANNSRGVQWAEPLIEPAGAPQTQTRQGIIKGWSTTQFRRKKATDEAMEQGAPIQAVVNSLIGEESEGREERIDRLLEKVNALRQQVKGFSTEIATKVTRRTMVAVNETEDTVAAALGDVLEARRMAQEPDAGVIAAREGHQNDDLLKRRCLFIDAPVRQWTPTGQRQSRWSTPVETLVDSGASRDFINAETVRQWGLKTEKAKQPLKVMVADGRSVKGWRGKTSYKTGKNLVIGIWGTNLVITEISQCSLHYTRFLPHPQRRGVRRDATAHTRPTAQVLIVVPVPWMRLREQS